MYKTILLDLLIAYIAIACVAYFFYGFLTYFPPRHTYQNSNELIKIKTSDGATICAVYLPNPKAKYTILISHGNAEDLGRIYHWLEDWQRNGYAVFAYDYHGYGLSSGKTNEKNTYLDADAAYDYLTQVLHIPAASIIIYGRSLGAAVALNLATRKKAAGLILESAFVTAFRVMTYINVLPFDRYNNLQKIKNYHDPILIIHGTADTLVPIWHGEKLFAAANKPKQYYWVKNATHNDVFLTAGIEYWRVIDGFVRSLQ